MLKQTLIAMLATMVLACSKEEKKISTEPGSFNTGMEQVEAISAERPGHYCYNLEIVRGENFNNKLYLNVNRNGSAGDLRVNGQEYQDGNMELGGSDNLLRIEYLPFSAGNHNVELIITDNSKAVKSSINLTGMFALGVNQADIPYMAWEYKPPFTAPAGAEYFSTKNKFPANREGLITVDHGGDGWLYVKHDGKVTGCFMKQTGTEYVEIEHLVIENIDFDGPTVIEEGKLPIIYGGGGMQTDKDFYFNITGVWPENATCQNPTVWYWINSPIHSIKDKIGMQIGGNEVFSFPCRIYNPLSRKYEERDLPAFELREPKIVIDNGTFLSADDERRNVKTLYLKKGERIKITTTIEPLTEEPIRWDDVTSLDKIYFNIEFVDGNYYVSVKDNAPEYRTVQFRARFYQKMAVLRIHSKNL